jgi:undecaprenyl diphosphate synthase
MALNMHKTHSFCEKQIITRTTTKGGRMLKRIPRHIGVIPDGNRRWASGRGFAKHEGYWHGVSPGFQLYELMLEHGIKEATFYGFTRDNNKREKEQRDAFTAACIKAVDLLAGRDANLMVIGNTESTALPKELLPYANKRVLFGKGAININFLVNYDWEWDLKTMLATGGTIASADISRIDLLIRWGGCRRLSGFLPVQSVYADFYVINDYWPDFRPEHFIEALEWYQGCDVTLGG